MTERIAVVTGAASGIGAEVCRQLAAQGCRLVLMDVDGTGGADVARAVHGHFIRCDVSDRAQWRAAVAECIEAVGVPDFAHLNAGIMSVSPREPFPAFEDLPEANYRRIIGVNLTGVVFGLQMLIPHMRDRPGAICATASLAGLVPLPFDPIYAATKHAVIGLIRSVAAAMPDGPLRVNAICPGGVDTAIIPDVLRRDDVAVMPAAVLATEVVDLLERGAHGEIRLKRDARSPAEAVPVALGRR